MKSRTIIMGMAAAVVAIGIYLTDADAQGGRRGGRGGQRGPTENLNLTEDQQEKLRSIRTEQSKMMTKLQADQRIAEIELREVVRNSNPDAKDVKSKVAAVNQFRSRIFESQIDFQLQTNKVYTPEQREQLRSRPQGRRGRGGLGIGRGGDRRGGRGSFQGRRGGGPPGGRRNFRGPGGQPQRGEQVPE